MGVKIHGLKQHVVWNDRPRRYRAETC